MEASRDSQIPPVTRICKGGRCTSRPQPLENFSIRQRDTKAGKKGELTASCTACMAKDLEKKRKKRAEKKKEQDDQKWTGIKMDAFVETLATVYHADIDLQVRIDMEDYLPIDLEGESRAKAVATMLDDVMGLHWTYYVHHIRKRHTDWIFSCAQSQSRSKKARTETETHARAPRRRMERGECDGWLRVMVKDGDSQLNISVKHKHSHASYGKISLGR